MINFWYVKICTYLRRLLSGLRYIGWVSFVIFLFHFWYFLWQISLSTFDFFFFKEGCWKALGSATSLKGHGGLWNKRSNQYFPKNFYLQTTISITRCHFLAFGPCGQLLAFQCVKGMTSSFMRLGTQTVAHSLTPQRERNTMLTPYHKWSFSVTHRKMSSRIRM